MNGKNWWKIGVFLVVIVGIGVMVFEIGNFSSEWKKGERTIIREETKKNDADVEQIAVAFRYDKNDDFQVHEEVEFFAIGNTVIQPKKIFSVKSDVINNNYGKLPEDFEFCQKNQKIYFPFSNDKMGEIDLHGNVRTFELSLKGLAYPNDETLLHTGFAVSPDCKNIVVSSMAEKEAAIDLVDIETGKVKTLVSLLQAKDKASKQIDRWSKKDKNKVYLNDYDWDRNGGGGGLYRLDIQTGVISEEVTDLPKEYDFFMDIAEDETLGALSASDMTGFDIYDFSAKKKVKSFDMDGSGRRMFSPSGEKLAYDVVSCPDDGKEACSSELFTADLSEKDPRKLGDIRSEVWIDENTIGGVDEKTGELVSVDIRSGEIRTVLSLSSSDLGFIPSI